MATSPGGEDPSILVARVGIAIKRHRQTMRMTQKALAERANVDQSTVSLVENASNVSLATLARIANALNVNVRDLIDFADDSGREEIARQAKG